MFKQPNPRQDFYELESAVLTWWKENDILKKSIDQRSDIDQYTFYDGPITANGAPHLGHMMTFAVKDLLPRYWTMRGKKVSRSLGWDCQGIPVEYEVEKKLGFKEKKDIEKYGIEKFNQLCRESVLEFKSNIIELEELMGRLTNADEEYATMDSWYIESVWWSLKELYTKGMLYEGFKIVPYSTRAGTTLSNAEVALGGYEPFVDPAITVAFELKDNPNTFVLAWTTTPWTIPGNLGLAVGKEIKYVQIKLNDSDKSYILAKDLVEQVLKNHEYTQIVELQATDLIGKEYIPPFDFFIGRKNAHQIYAGEFVSTESGTGIVHLAPYGAEDNELFQKVGIESFDYLNDQGDFTDLVSSYQGLNYRDANTRIIEDLKSKELLFHHEEYTHEMPMCWRTKTPLIYKPITSWYVGVSKIRDRLVELNNTIKWVPDNIREGRFGNWLAEIKDWGISRLRYWGTPLPIWKSESGKVILIGSFEELEKYSGVKLDDPHRPFVDAVEFDFEGDHYKRIPDVLDVWYDSGAMPFARLHYPFENKEKFEKKFPAQFIGESIDQTRGWFYSLHAIAATVFDNIAFENVIVNGFTLDDRGVKQSKSKKNYTDPIPTIKKFGADACRLSFFNSPIVYGENTTVSDKTIKLQVQEFILPVWNIFSYLTTYANMHGWVPREELAYNGRNITGDIHPWDHIPFDDINNEIDAWILVALQKTIKKVNVEMEEYNIPKATRAIKDLIDETSKWYIRSNRDRFTSGDTRALEILYYVLVETSKLLAPFAPFVSEYMYQNLVSNELQNQKESVHLTDFPMHDQKFMDEYAKVDEEMNILRAIIELGHTIRTENGLKVRQPLGKLFVTSQNQVVPEVMPWMQEIIANELNVKIVQNSANLPESEYIKSHKNDSLAIAIGMDTELTAELKQEGLLRELSRQIQSLRKNMRLQMGDKIVIHLMTESSLVINLIQELGEELKKNVNANQILVVSSSENMEEFTIDGEIVKVHIIKA